MRNQVSVKGKQTHIIQVDTTWMTSQHKIWVESADPKEDIFQKALLDRVDGQTVHFTVSGRQSSAAAHLIHERASDYNDKSYKGHDDMVNMEIINDAELLVNITLRYQGNAIFTYVGPTLLIVNPFQKVQGVFEEATKLRYIGEIIFQKNVNYKDLPPHIYALGAEAYRSLFETRKNQAIVISGESGAGKTENAKYCMNLMTSIGSFGEAVVSTTAQQVGIEDKILSCNPILEAFGNAKTVRNNNSSRFGKYVYMKVSSEDRKIKGAEIINYLLEKSRVVSQGANERNFHIFYHFMKGMTVEQLSKYHLADGTTKVAIEDLKYIKGATQPVKGINDVALFEEVLTSLQLLGFEGDTQNIFQIVAIVLHLGQLQFEEPVDDSQPCSVGPPTVLEHLSELLAMSQEDIKLCMTVRQRELQKQLVNSPLIRVDCLGMRDAWAKELYERLFNWLVERLNKNLVPGAEGEYLSLGLLDIYGFEVFERNGFEQLMINYTNEKLHQLYITYVFKGEQDVFLREGLKEHCGEIKFTDNQQVIDLLDKYPIGIFELLDESCQLKADDDMLLTQIRKQHKDSALLLQPKMPSKSAFIVLHTAKDVEYAIQGFREKNKDEVPALMMRLNAASSNALVSTLFRDDKSKKNKSLARKVRNQLTELMKELTSCEVHFARCIKPNDEKVPLKIVQEYALNQVRYLGVLDSLKVRKQNYPIRRPYALFYKRYGDMTKNALYPQLLSEGANFRDLVVALFKHYFPQMGPSLVLFGNERIFVRLEAMPDIESKFRECIEAKNTSARKIQRAWAANRLRVGLHRLHARIGKWRTQIKAFRQVLYYKKKLVSCVKIQRWMRRWFVESRTKLYKKQAGLLQKAIRRATAVTRMTKIQVSVVRIQRYVKMALKQSKWRKQACCRRLIERALSVAWQVILGRRVTRIQTSWRGYWCRHHTNKSEVRQIREVRRQLQLRKVVVTIQRYARGYLVRRKLREMGLAAHVIQGYVKMRWLSDLFQSMRVSVLIIQHRVRTFLANRHAQRIKYEKYILPWELALQTQKQREEHHLFGVEDYDSPNKTLQRTNTNLSPFSYTSINAVNTTTTTSSNKQNYFVPKSETTSFDDVLAKDPDIHSTKIQLFAFVVDLEILADTSECFAPSWSHHYKQLFRATYGSGNPIQTLHAGSQQCHASTTTGKVFTWGANDHSPRKSTQAYTSVPMPGRVVQIESGADHTLFLMQDGRLYASGSNAQGQLIGEALNYDMRELQSNIKSMSSTYNTTLTVTEDGRVYTWPVRNDLGELLQEPLQLNLPAGHLVQQVSCGNRFALLLTQQGNLFSFGENSEGELGLGNRELQIHPTQVQARNIKFDQISCGFKHSLARTTLGRAYSWGWGAQGQLGHGSYANVLEPHLIDLDCVAQVQASFRSSLLLLDAKTVLWCGTNTQLHHQCDFTELRVKSTQLQQPHYSVVRVMATFSRSYSLVYLTYARHKNMFKSNPAKERGVLHTLTHHWLAGGGIRSVDPPTIDSISNYVCEKHMKKTMMSSPKQFSTRALHHHGLHSPDTKSSAHLNLSKASVSRIILRESPQPSLYNITHLSPSPQNELQDDVLQPMTFNNTQQLLDQEERERKTLRLLDQQASHIKVEHTIKVEPILEPVEVVAPQPKKKSQNYYNSARSPGFDRAATKSPINQVRGGGRPQPDPNKSMTRTTTTTKTKTIIHKEKRLQIDTKSREGMNTSKVAKQQQSKAETDSDNSTESKITRLREMKERLKYLKSVPQAQWKTQDHEFLKNIYNSNLSTLLDL